MIDDKKLIEDVYKSMENNPHKDAKVRANHNYEHKHFIDLINRQPQISTWISVSERMPDEHDSIFIRFKGANKWRDAMFENVSDDVNVTIEFEDGTRKTMTTHTTDGKWKLDTLMKCRVIAWKPLPEPWEEQYDIY